MGRNVDGVSRGKILDVDGIGLSEDSVFADGASEVGCESV